MRWVRKFPAFWFKDKYGTSYINVNSQKKRASVQQQFLQVIVPDAKLRATSLRGGAVGRVEVLSAVEVIK
jgi:hypothetical protein